MHLTHHIPVPTRVMPLPDSELCASLMLHCSWVSQVLRRDSYPALQDQLEVKPPL